jgi:hypothetical protein
LVGEYFETPYFKDYMKPIAVPSFSRIDADLNFEPGMFAPLNDFDRSINPVASLKNFGSQYFSVRWTGLLKAKYTEVYTLQCTSYSAVKLYIDGVVILSKPGTAERQGVQGTVSLVQSSFFAIRIDYAHTIGQFGMTFEWKSKSEPNSPVPPSALWHSESGSMPEFTVPAVAGAAMLSRSILNGTGLTIATAGILSTFTISVYDEIGLPSSLDTCQMWSRALIAGGASLSPIRSTQIRSSSISSYVISYVPSISSEYTFDTSCMTPGGLISTFYGSSVFLKPVAIAGVIGLSLNSSLFAAPFNNASLLSASWRGFFKPTSVPVTSFLIQLGSSTDAFKLVVDGVPLIDKTSNGLFAGSLAATVSLSDSNSFYEIAVDFSHTSGSLSLGVSTQQGAVSSGQLFSQTTVGLPPPTLLVQSGIACAATSKLMGVGAVDTMASDLQGGIELHIRDAFNNPTSIGTRRVRATAYSAACTEIGFPPCDASVKLDAFQVSNSVWGIVVLLTRSGKWSVAVAFAQPGFLSATYYSSIGLLSPASVVPVAMNTSLSVTSKSLRMAGFIKPVEGIDVFSFMWGGNHVYYPSLFIDDPFVGARAANYALLANTSIVINDTLATSTTRHLKIDAPYLQPGIQLSLMWSYENVSWTVVPSHRLFTREDIQTVLIDVLPAKTCASSTFIKGDSLTIATCGIDATFSILTRDMYANIQSSLQDRWIVRLLKNATTIVLTTADQTNSNKVTLPGLSESSQYFISSKGMRLI